MSLGSMVKKGWMWIVGAVAATGGAVWGVIAWIGASATIPAVVTTTTATVFVLSFSDKGWIDQFQEPADEAFALAEQSKPEEAIKVLDDIDEKIDTYAQSVKDGTAEVEDAEKATAHAARADAVWAIVRQTVDYQSSENQGQWVQQVAGAIKGHPEAKDAMRSGLALVKAQVNEEDLIALMQAELSIESRGVVVGEIMARRQASEKAPTAEDARFLEDLLLDIYETPEGAQVVTEYVKAQDALGETEAANTVLETILGLAADSETGVAAVRARLRNPEESPETIIRLYRAYPDSEASEAIQPLYVQALMDSGKATEAVLEHLGEDEWNGRHDSPASVAGQVYRRARSIIDTNPDATQSVVDVCVALAERLTVDGEVKFPAALLLEVLDQEQVLPVNQMTRRPIRSAGLLGDLEQEQQAKTIINYIRGLVQIHQSRWEDARGLLEEVAESEHASPMTQAHAMVALAQGYEAEGDFDYAIELIKDASSTLPNSLMLRDSVRDYEARRDQAVILARLERQVDQIRRQAETAATAEQTIEHYESIAELYLASGYGEQAVGILIQTSEDYGNNPAAPKLLRQAIQVLRDYQLNDYEARVRTIERRLDREYADF